MVACMTPAPVYAFRTTPTGDVHLRGDSSLTMLCGAESTRGGVWYRRGANPEITCTACKAELARQALESSGEC